MCYCVLVLLGKCIQSAVFGELRVSESQAMKDTFWNFVFYKFIFIFGVLSVQKLEEVVLWCSWFTLLGFLHHLAQLARERADYVIYPLLFFKNNLVFNFIKKCLTENVFSQTNFYTIYKDIYF